MQKSSSCSYIENFKSDIFNQKPITPTVHYHKISHAPSLTKTSNDIFSMPTEPGSRSLERCKGIKTFASHSDIFFTKPSLDKSHFDPSTRNVSNKSTVFSHYDTKDYRVKKNQMKTNYNPEHYYSKETPTERHFREFHNGCGLKKLRNKSQLGFYEKEESKLNNTQSVPEITTPIKKKCNWNYKNSANVNYINADESTEKDINSKRYQTAKTNRLLDQQSNIFNQPDKETINVHKHDYNINNLYKGVGTETEPKHYKKVKTWKNVAHTKWQTKIDWIKENTEILFKKYDDKKEEQKSAFDRKLQELSGDEDIIVPKKGKESVKKALFKIAKKNLSMKDDNTEDIKRINKIVNITTPMKKDKQYKYMENVSSVGFDRDFYMRNMKYKNGDDSEHEYQLKATNNSNIIDDLVVRKMLCKEGIHAYDITPINDGMNKDSAIKFKVRENDSHQFKEHFDTVKEKLQKEEGVSIEPIQKIKVNKRKDGNDINIKWQGKQVFPDQDMNKPKYIKIARTNKDRLSDQFMLVNNKYKNEGLKGLKK